MFGWFSLISGLVFKETAACSEMFNMPSAEGHAWPFQSSCWGEPAKLLVPDLPSPDPKCSQWMPGDPSESFHEGEILHPLGKSCDNYSHSLDSENQLVSLREVVVKKSLW